MRIAPEGPCQRGSLAQKHHRPHARAAAVVQLAPLRTKAYICFLEKKKRDALMPGVRPGEGRVKYERVAAVGRLLHVQLWSKGVQG